MAAVAPGFEIPQTEGRVVVLTFGIELESIFIIWYTDKVNKGMTEEPVCKPFVFAI